MVSDILNDSFEALPLSEQFKMTAIRLGFRNIKEVSEVKPTALINMEGFDYLWLGELIDFLKAEGKLDVLQKI